MLQRWDLDQLKKTTFKLLFGTKWIQIIAKHQTHIHDKNVKVKWVVYPRINY